FSSGDCATMISKPSLPSRSSSSSRKTELQAEALERSVSTRHETARRPTARNRHSGSTERTAPAIPELDHFAQPSTFGCRSGFDRIPARSTYGGFTARDLYLEVYPHMPTRAVSLVTGHYGSEIGMPRQLPHRPTPRRSA